MTEAPRRPTAVRLDDAAVELVAERSPKVAETAPDTEMPLEDAAIPRSGFGWLGMVGAAATALLSLAFGLWLDSLIRELFAVYPALGWAGIALAGILVICLLGFIWREIAAILRLNRLEGLRNRAAEAIETDRRETGLAVVDALARLYANRPETARGRAALSGLREDIIDGAALMGLAEDHLMADLDARGIHLVTQAAKRVSIVTAVSPRAIIDVGYVLFEALRLVRTVSALYGGRPGFVGFTRLAKSVVAHLAVTGGIAAGDALLQQVLGTGLASRISARLGEGVLNGFLTARIGLAAMDLCRPLPFSEKTRPTLNRIMSSILANEPELQAAKNQKRS